MTAILQQLHLRRPAGGAVQGHNRWATGAALAQSERPGTYELATQAPAGSPNSGAAAHQCAAAHLPPPAACAGPAPLVLLGFTALALEYSSEQGDTPPAAEAKRAE